MAALNGGTSMTRSAMLLNCLPSHPRPKDQPNPIDKLHELTSEGLHSKSEGECIDVFDRVRTVFEYVFGNLRIPPIM